MQMYPRVVVCAGKWQAASGGVSGGGLGSWEAQEHFSSGDVPAYLIYLNIVSEFSIIHLKFSYVYHYISNVYIVFSFFM